MRRLAMIIFSLLLSGQCAFIFAQDAVRAFSSELLHESKQVLTGKARAVALAERISPTVASSRVAPIAPNSATGLRAVASGIQVYNAQCIACHATGATGAPRQNDMNAWRVRIPQGFDQLVKSTLKGKGAMGQQGGGDFQDFEIARAVAYLSNTAGGTFKEPRLPPGHSGKVTFKLPPPPQPIVPYADMSADKRLKLGEQTFQINCSVCHSPNGQSFGVIPGVANAPGFIDNSSAIRLLLIGSKKGMMPTYGHLTDAEIAEVINFSRVRFNNLPVAIVTAEEVRATR
jgi:cytochrome c5